MLLDAEVKRLELVQLTKKLDAANDKYNELEAEIEDLEADRDFVGTNIGYLEARIATLKKEMTDSLINAILNRQPENEFQYCFLKAIQFCSTDENRPLMEYVDVKEEVMYACNGYMAIEIKCGSIPDECKNKAIRWDATDFVNIPDLMDGVILLNVKKVLDDYETMDNERIMKSEIESMIKIDEKNSFKEKQVVRLKEIAFNKKYLDTAIGVLDDGVVEIVFGDPIQPVIFKMDKIRVLVLPVRTE
ncbi:MAG: hypothetical protein SFH39_00180 [Candidatus Magnetobacterium sp. LHC-1]